MMGSVNALCLPKPGLLVSVGADKGIQLWDLQAEKQLKRMENNRIIQCVVAMSETVIATGAEDGTIKTWDVDLNAVNEEGAVKKWSQRARKLNELSGHTGAVNGLDVFNDNMLISGSSDGTVCAWETDTGTQTVKLEGHEAAVNDVIKVDDSTIASCSADKTIRIWNFAPTEAGGSSLKATWEDAHKGQNVLCLIRISDSVIASGGGDFLAKVWDIGDGGTLAALKGHTSAVQSLAVIDDRILATGSADMTVRCVQQTSPARPDTALAPAALWSFVLLLTMWVVGLQLARRLWDIDKHYKLVKTVGAAKGGINFSINGLCAVRFQY
jgi:WD40 repeat protein